MSTTTLLYFRAQLQKCSLPDKLDSLDGLIAKVPSEVSYLQHTEGVHLEPPRSFRNA